MDSMELICCLCNFEAAEDEELTHHIDSVHSEIFRICNDFGAPQNLSAQVGTLCLSAGLMRIGQ